VEGSKDDVILDDKRGANPSAELLGIAGLQRLL